MKEKFWGYIPYDNEIFKNLWKNSKIVVDANILLNLYRYSKDTQQQILNCLEQLSDRLWVPYNTMHEYFNNRIAVICEQEDLYKKVKGYVSFSDAKDKIRGIRHLTLGPKKDNIINIIEKCEKDISEIIDKDKEDAKDYLKKDLVLSNIIKLLDGKVGNGINDESELQNLKKQIDKRYEQKIPPGFEDAKKNKDGRKYGDCINWLEIIKYSKEHKENIIYVTDDKKDDWIQEVNGQKTGPRPELLNEFYKETNGNIIYIYNTRGFLNNFNKYVDMNIELKVSAETINEVKDLESNVFVDNEFFKIGTEKNGKEASGLKRLANEITIEYNMYRQTYSYDNIKIRLNILNSILHKCYEFLNMCETTIDRNSGTSIYSDYTLIRSRKQYIRISKITEEIHNELKMINNEYGSS